MNVKIFLISFVLLSINGCTINPPHQDYCLEPKINNNTSTVYNIHSSGC